MLKNRKVAAVATLLVAAAVFHEAQYFRFPSIEPPPKKVAVIGDSISSGGFSETTAWPNLLSIPAVNLSMPSETVRSALDNQASRLAETGADLVVVEIGGNDMLGGTSPRDFARDLERLLRMAVERRRVVMLELPLLPGKWSFGAAQRRLARKYGVILVPKRVLARVLTSADHTSDALHLTQRGHDELAKKIGHALGARARADR